MPYTHSHDPILVTIAVLIGILASYSALDLMGRVRASTGRRRVQWLIGGAIAMGSGIWSMHFTATMAFELPIPVTYDARIVVISWLAAVAAAAVALSTTSHLQVTKVHLILGSIMMAMSISIMHYVAMGAMQLEATLSYTPLYLRLSMIIALLASLLALWLFTRFHGENPSLWNLMKLLSAVVMGGAISGTYFAMTYAANFTAAPGLEIDTSWTVDISTLGAGAIVVITAIVLGFSLFAAVVDQRLSSQDEKLKEYINEITELNEKLKKENVRLGAEVEITQRIQQMILPRDEELRAVHNLDIAGFMQPASEIGGDYYDVLHENGCVKIGIGDVTDHGLESGVIMLMTQTAVRTLLNCGETDPIRFLDILNRTVYGNVQRMQTDRNLSLSLLDYAANDESGGRVRLSGQHEEMIIIRKDGTSEIIDTIDLGFPIGLDGNITDFLDHRTLDLEPGDGVVLYTDGITEAENTRGEQYGIERLVQSASNFWSESASLIQQRIIEDLRQYIGEQIVYDDITLLVVKQR